jgi:hypothetical protein
MRLFRQYLYDLKYLSNPLSLDILRPDRDIVSRPLGIDDVPISALGFGVGGTSIRESSPFAANLQAS